MLPIQKATRDRGRGIFAAEASGRYAMPAWLFGRRAVDTKARRPFSLDRAISRLAAGVPVALSLLAVPGCQTERASRPQLSALSPMRWFARQEPAPADDDFQLLPVPQGGYEAPPVPPPSRTGRAFVPAAPAPDPGAFYGVRPTGAEDEDTAGSSWVDKFRNAFRRPQKDEPEPLRPIGS